MVRDLFDRHELLAGPRWFLLSRVGDDYLPLGWSWWSLQLLQLQPLGTELLLHRLAAKLLLPQLVVLLLMLCFGEHGLLPLRSCRHLWLRRFCFQGPLLNPSCLFDASVDTTHRRDVFGCDAEVQKVDFKLAICEGIDGDAVAASPVRLCCCCFALRGCCRRHCLVLRSSSGGPSLLRRRHVVYRTDGWAPNCWWGVSPERTNTTTVMNG